MIKNENHIAHDLHQKLNALYDLCSILVLTEIGECKDLDPDDIVLPISIIKEIIFLTKEQQKEQLKVLRDELHVLGI